LDNVVIKTTY